MPLGGWLHYLAIGGILVAALCADEGQAQSNSYPVEDQGQSKTAAPESYTTPDCKTPKSSEDANLCEQRRSADASAQQAHWGELQVVWARVQAWANIAQIVLGIVGLGAVIVTLIYSARATKAASRAAEAADASVAVASQNAERELRAYVFVKEWNLAVTREPDKVGTFGGRVEGRPTNYTVTAVIENSGSTPTRNLVSNMSFRFFGNDGLPSDFNYPDVDQPSLAVIGPRSAIDSISISFAAGDLAVLGAFSSRCFIWGWFDYNDVFEGTPRHRTEFCFEMIVRVQMHGDELRFKFAAAGPFNGADGDCMRQPKPYKS